MSGLPNPDSVLKFRMAVLKMRHSNDRLAKIRTEMVKLRGEAENHQELFNSARKEVFSIMDDMDVQSNGNFGYEGRMTAFLIELFNQLIIDRTT